MTLRVRLLHFVRNDSLMRLWKKFPSPAQKRLGEESQVVEGENLGTHISNY